MLNDEQAGKIVINCIRAVSGASIVSMTGSLRQAELIDSDRVIHMITLIVNSPNIGVPSEFHRIDEGWFQNVDPDTIVNAVINIVRDKASQIHANMMEDLASLVASKLALHLTPTLEKTAAEFPLKETKKRRKKADK
jgi:hypothetical protein